MESAPFAGVVLCCTSIPVDLRTDVAEKVTELGGIHKNDLTHEVTHLIVGDYNTPKYRHVAYERPDIKAMCLGWVDAVRNLWTQDAPIDMPALEAEWQMRPFEVHGGFPTGGPDGKPIERGRLLCSVTGFEEEDRQNVIDTIVRNGGTYNGDLTRAVTHLIVNKPEGKKYAAAMHWNIKTVSIEWLRDCVQRGMILDESKYDPRLPPEERGKGAVRTAAERSAILGKRLRESAAAQVAAAAAEKNGQRKLRKTASKKLSVQRDDLWGHILGKPSDSATPSPAPESRPAASANADAAAQWQPPQPALEEPQRQTAEASRTQAPVPVPVPAPARAPATVPSPAPAPQQQPQQQRPPPPLPTADTGGVLSTSIFYIHGFSRERNEVLAGAVATMGGLIAPSLEQMAALAAPDPNDDQPNSGYARLRQHVIVPQTSRPSSHPKVDSGDGADHVLFVTEFFIEKCLHKKQYALPADVSNKDPPLDGCIIGMPFRVFPLPGFDTLSICTSGFTGVDLNQVDKTVRQLGAKYEERFTAQCAVLVVTSLPAVRKQKLELALQWKVPVVYAKWLWACIAAGAFVSVEPYLFPQLRQELAKLNGAAAAASRKLPEPTMALTVPTLVMPSPHTRHAAAPAAAAAAAAAPRKNRRHTGFEDDDDDDDDDDMNMSSAAPLETAPTTHVDAPSTAASVSAAATAEKTAPSAPLPLQDLPLLPNSRRSMSPAKRDPKSQQQTQQTPQQQQPPQEEQLSAAPASKPQSHPPRRPLDRVLSEVADSDDPDDSGDEERPVADRQKLSRAASAASSSTSASAPKPALTDAAASTTTTTAAPAAATAGLQRSSTMGGTTAAASSSTSSSSRPAAGAKHKTFSRPPLSRVQSEGLAAAPSVVHHPHVPIDISLGDLMKDSGQHVKAGRNNGGVGRTFSRAYSGVSGSGGNDGSGGAGVAISTGPVSSDGAAAVDDDTPSQSMQLLPPTQVQVQYLDPEADRIHEQLMRKIRGGGGGDDAPAADPLGEPAAATTTTHGRAPADEARAKAAHSRRRSSRLR